MRGARRALRVGAGMVLAAGGAALVGDPERAPVWVLGGLLTVAWPLAVAWRAARGTALRASIVWGALAALLGGVAQGIAWESPWPEADRGRGTGRTSRRWRRWRP
jgi:hypothetical protein